MRTTAALLLATLVTVAVHATTAAAQGSDAEPPAGITAAAPNAFRLTIPSNGAKLHAAAWLAEGSGERPTALILRGFGGPRLDDSASLAVRAEPSPGLFAELRRGGWHVVQVNFRGYVGSEGGWSYGNALADARAALAWLRRADVSRALRVDPARIVLVGWSMGGGEALLVAGEEQRMRCVVAIVPFNVTRGFEPRGVTPEVYAGLARNNASSIRLASETDFLGDLRQNLPAYDIRNAGARLAGRPVLVVAAREDKVVPIAQLTELAARYREAGARVELAEFDDDHAFPRDEPAMGRKVAGWLGAECR